MEPTTKHTKGAGTAAIADIVVGKRDREPTEAVMDGIANELVPSIAEHGLIQPIVVELLEDGKLHLIAGWRRMTAMSLLGHKEIPFTFREDLGPVERAILEIEENLHRVDPPFKDCVLAVANVHRMMIELKSTSKEKWTQRKTGEMLGTDHGNVSETLAAAKMIMEGDMEVANAAGLWEVRGIVHRRKIDEGAKVLRERAKSQVGGTVKPDPAKGISLVGDDAADSSVSSLESLLDNGEAKIEVPITQWMLNMDNREWFTQREAASVDLIVTDIPYGIDVKNDMAEMVNHQRVVDAHDIDENLSQFPTFIDGAWKVLKDGSYLMFWYALEHHNTLIDMLENRGFTVQKWPLIWLKASAKNMAPNTWYTKATEFVMVARKGTASLNKPMTLNYKACSAAAERKTYLNPFYKPWEFTRWQLEHIITQNMVCVDCYMGESSILKVMYELGGQVIGIEKSELHYNRALEHMKEQVRRKLKGNVIFT